MIFAAGALGLVLHHILPQKHVTGGAKDMIGAVVGLLTLLSALVLGLLITGPRTGSIPPKTRQFESLAAKVLDFDLALAEYGPEANAARAQLKQSLAATIDQLWGAPESDSTFAANDFNATIRNKRNWEASLVNLHPSTEAQKEALATAKWGASRLAETSGCGN